jgi:hypothetical protein
VIRDGTLIVSRDAARLERSSSNQRCTTSISHRFGSTPSEYNKAAILEHGR